MANVDFLSARAFTLPTDFPEADGTIEWRSTSLIVVEARCEAVAGIGYSYADKAAAEVIERVLSEYVIGADAMSPPAANALMQRAVRNLGRAGIASCAISAVDVALWDLKAKILGLALCDLLGSVRNEVAVYGSGGFTSYDNARLQKQLGGWAEQGCAFVKMKIGCEANMLERVRAAREAIGDGVQLFVDANGAYDQRLAIGHAGALTAFDVRWFEEPVSSDDLVGMRFVREHAPANMAIAAGEYGYDARYFEHMRDAVDVLQADATRCLGVSGFMQVSALCDLHGIPLSAHTSPSLHLHLGCAAPRLAHVEWFHDHARIEEALFDGAPKIHAGKISPNRSRRGLGLSLRPEAERYAV